MIISAVRDLPVPKILVLLQSNDLIDIPIFDTQNNGGHDGRHLVEEFRCVPNNFVTFFVYTPNIRTTIETLQHYGTKADDWRNFMFAYTAFLMWMM